MSQKLSDDDITELCKAIEIYQNELKKAELEITHLNSKLEETNEKMKIYEELEETILQLDNDLTSCKQTLNQKIHECDELQKENNELQGVIRTTTDCLEELHRSKSTSQNVPSHNADLRRQLEDSEAIRIEQEKKMKIYENQIKKLQDSIDRLQTENESLRTKVTTLEHRASSPVNLVPRYKPGCSDSTPHSFQKKTPPRSARRLIQSSTSSHGESESPKTSSVPPPTYSWETRRHSSYTSGDYVVSYAMKQQEESRKRDQLMASEDRDSAISPKKPAKPQSTVTHPYYPHSPAASTLWQEAIAFEVSPIVFAFNF